MLNHLFMHCRAGFEKDCAAEITALAAELGVFGFCKTKGHTAFVVFIGNGPDDAQTLLRGLVFKKFIFIRQWFACVPFMGELSTEDRITPLLDACPELPLCKTLVMETVDTNEGKALSGLAKKLENRLEAGLRKKGFLRAKSDNRLHVVFLSGSEAYIGYSPIENSAAWASGIPRMKVSREAPSRATLKLEEAFHHFIPEDEWDHRLGGGMRAVDLGAAPGAWTYQLVKRDMFVEAVDTGLMQEALMDSGQVKQHKLDSFNYTPHKRVHWVVCDIADKPQKIAKLMARWVANNWCGETIFNLKLPAKQRYAEVQLCAKLIEKAVKAADVKIDMNFKQLYNNREEVAVHIRRLG